MKLIYRILLHLSLDQSPDHPGSAIYFYASN